MIILLFIIMLFINPRIALLLLLLDIAMAIGMACY